MQCIAFIHPGYLLREDGENVDLPWLHEIRTTECYGWYQKYLARVVRLYKEQGTHAVFFVQLLNGKLHPYLQAFTPPPTSTVIDFPAKYEDGGYSFAALEQNGELWHAQQELSEDKLGPFLKERGIESLVLAGELGPYTHSHQGCVGTIYSILRPTMDVKGAKHCIFPLIPDKHWVDQTMYEIATQSRILPIERLQEQEQLYKDLYDEAIEIFPRPKIPPLDTLPPRFAH